MSCDYCRRSARHRPLRDANRDRGRAILAHSMGGGLAVIEIRLTWSEVLLAINAGVMRRCYAIKSGKLSAYGARMESAWDNDINGAIAEFGCAKWANVFWNGTVGVTTASDVGRWQVRSKVVIGHRLVVRPDDNDDEIFISVLVQIPIVTLCGWLSGREAKQPRWLQTYDPKPPMYFIEDEFLRPMEELPR